MSVNATENIQPHDSADQAAPPVDASTANSLPDSVKELIQPFADKPEGEDPRYGDSFVKIKQEIDKLSDNDYNSVVDLGRKILSEEGKDYRVAGYYVLASAYVTGMAGALESILVYKKLIEEFHDSAYPKKESAKRNALKWLNNEKLLTYVRQASDSANYSEIVELIDMVAAFNDTIADKIEDGDVPKLTILDKHLKSTAEKKKPVKASKDEAEKVQEIKTGDDTETRKQAEGRLQGKETIKTSIESEKDLINHTKSLITYLFEKKEYLRAAGITRAVKWGGAVYPPNDNGKTRIPAPRKGGVAEIKQHLANSDYEAVLRSCENMMFEPGGNYFLDLQWYAYQAAVGMKQEVLASYISQQTVSFVDRVKGVQELVFDDGTPFAESSTLFWIDENRQNGFVAGIQQKLDDKLEEVISLARKKAQESSLQEALAEFVSYSAYTNSQQFKMKLAMAIICAENERADIALPVFEELSRNADEYNLGYWDSDLHIQLAKHYQKAVMSVMATAAEDEKVLYDATIKELTRKICCLDIQQAVTVL